MKKLLFVLVGIILITGCANPYRPRDFRRDYPNEPITAGPAIYYRDINRKEATSGFVMSSVTLVGGIIVLGHVNDTRDAKARGLRDPIAISSFTLLVYSMFKGVQPYYEASEEWEREIKEKDSNSRWTGEHIPPAERR